MSTDGVQFRASLRRRGRVMVVELAGDLDLKASQEITRALDHALREDVERIDVDTRRLEFIDSTGMTALLRARQQAEERGQQLRLTEAAPWLRRLLDITGTHQLLLVD